MKHLQKRKHGCLIDVRLLRLGVGAKIITFGRLSNLQVPLVESNSENMWATDVLAKTCPTLQQLQLGEESILPRAFHRRQPWYEYAKKFDLVLHSLKRGRYKDTEVTLNLKSLEFCYCHLAALLENGINGIDSDSGHFGRAISWSSLTSLTLESCNGYLAAFRYLSAPERQLVNLQSFYLRHEGNDFEQIFLDRLKLFIFSLRPL